MHSIRQTCRSALLESNAAFLTANGSRRAFSRSTTYYRGSLPRFLPSSSSKLEGLLADLNTYILLPCHLTDEQRKLVFKPENKAKLEQEPIEVTLGELTFPLTHIDVMRDVPPYRMNFHQISKYSRTPEDWENMIRVLEGYENAPRIALPQMAISKLLRRMVMADMQHLMLKIIQRPKETGVRLRNREYIRLFVRGIREIAWESGWEKEQLKRALSMAEQFVELLDNDEHLGNPGEGQQDYRGNPDIVALPLEMAAELASRYECNLDEVKKYAPRFMASLRDPDSWKDLMGQTRVLFGQSEADFDSFHSQELAAHEVTNGTMVLIGVWNALSTTRTVLGDDMPQGAEAARLQKELRKLIQQGFEARTRLGVREGVHMFAERRYEYAEHVHNTFKACEGIDD